MASPEIWGSRLWRLLHGLADVSDRRDVYGLWNTFLKYTAIVIPCQKCQKHMAEYWAHTIFLPKSWTQMTGEQVREDIRRKLHAFHNSVNERLGKPQYPWTSLESVDRSTLVQELQTIFDGLKTEWGAAHLEWKHTGNLLLQLVRGGSN